MSAKNFKPAYPKKEMTEEEKKELFLQAYTQKRAALAEGIMMNLMRNPSLTAVCLENEKTPAQLADAWAKECMEVIYHQNITITEEEA